MEGQRRSRSKGSNAPIGRNDLVSTSLGGTAGGLSAITRDIYKPVKLKENFIRHH